MTTLTKLAISNDKENKTRSILVIISVILTTLLLTVILLWGYGLIRDNKIYAGETYGDYYARLRNVKEEGVKELGRYSQFTKIARLAYAGNAQDDKMNLQLLWSDDTYREIAYFDKNMVDGTYPAAENEIMAQPGFFARLGYENVKVGDTITMSFRTNMASKYEPKEMVISGLLVQPEMEYETSGYNAYVSEEFFRKTMPEKEQIFNVYFSLSEEIEINTDNAEKVISGLVQECGFKENQLKVNTMYLLWKLDPGTETITLCGILAAIVVLFSIMVIYNIFQVGIIQKIQEYGKIKALGAEKRQLKKIVFREGMLLAAIGIPVGLILGYFVAEVSYSWSMGMAVAGRESGSLFSLPLFAASALISFLAVWAALHKPMRITAFISPIEAIRYQENSGVGKKKSKKKEKNGLRKGKAEVSVMSMTLANLSASKKRTVATIMTMGLSCVLFVVMANFMGNIDEEYNIRREVEYGRIALDLEYSFSDTAYPENNLENIIKNNPLNAEVIEQIRQIEGVTDVKIRKVLSAVIDGKNTSIGVYDRETFEREAKAGGELGELDYDKVSEENGIIHGWSYFMGDEGFTLGKEISATVADDKGSVPFTAPITSAFGSSGTGWIITEETYNNLNLTGEAIGDIWIDCAKEDEESVKAAVEAIFEGVEHVGMETYGNTMKMTQVQTRMMQMAVYAFLAIIGLIGFMNMANTMIISIITRKQEFGVLQAVGMTNSQLNKSLQMEGLIFTLGTVFVSMAAGIPLGYAFFRYAKANAFYGMNVYHFPVAEIIGMIGLLMVLQLILSFVLSRNVKKESLIERIRYQG